MEQTKTTLTAQVQELEDQLLSFFSRKTETQGIEMLLAFQSDIRKSLSSMKEALDEHPHFGAIALFGHFEFDDSCAKLRSLVTGSSASLFEEIRAARSVKISQDVQSSWEFIKQNPETACAVIGICFLGNKRVKVRRILNKIKQHTSSW
jgi:hypothetical protein